MDGVTRTADGPAWDVVEFADVTSVRLNWLPPEPDRLRGTNWLQRHGVDSRDVLVPGWVELHHSSRKVLYLAPVRDDHGTPLMADRDGNPVPNGHDHVGEIAKRAAVIQLESPPQPWPMPAPTEKPTWEDE